MGGGAHGLVAGIGRRAPRSLRTVALAGTLALSALWAVAFVGLYHVDEHPWVAASRWIYEHVPDGSRVATEHWDYALPVRLRATDTDANRSFRKVELEWYDVEDRLGREKDRVELGSVLSEVVESDYLILASNRLYGVIPCLPERYPEAAAYYRLLFSGRLGYKLVHWSGRYPTLGPLTVVDDTFAWPGLPFPPLEGWRPGSTTLNLGPADESFTVYDHPLVLIFENSGGLSAVEMESLIRAETISD